MKRAAVLFAFLMTTALASRPNCGDFADPNKYYFDTKGNILTRDYLTTLTDQGLKDPSTQEYFRRVAGAFKYHKSQLIAIPLSPFGWSFVGKLDPREAKGTPFATLLEPGYLEKRLAADQQRIKLYRSAGLPVADFIGMALPAFRANSNLTLYYPQDNHWTADGAQIGSKAIASELAKINPKLKADLNTKHFDVKVGTTQYFDKNGWPGLIHSTCPTVAWTPLTETIANVQSVALDETSLLGDEPAPPTVLLGSSYSTSVRGFAAYMQKDLGADMINASLAGGGLFGSMREYFTTSAAQPWAKLFVWEYPDSLAFPDIEFRQVLPLLLPSAEVERSDFSASDKNVAHSLKSGNVVGNRFVVEVVLDKPETRELSVTLTYADHAETVALAKPRGDVPTRFLVELTGKTPLKAVAVNVPGKTPTGGHLVIRKYEEAAYAFGLSGK